MENPSDSLYYLSFEGGQELFDIIKYIENSDCLKSKEKIKTIVFKEDQAAFF